METFLKKDPNLLNKMRQKKMNDFSKIRKGSNYNAYVRKNLGSIPSKFDNFIFKLPEESKSNLTSVINPMMAKDENLCFRKDIFKREHKSWNNFGSGNSIELKGNSVKFMINNTLRDNKKNSSEFDSSNIESFRTVYSNSNNSTNHTFYNKNFHNSNNNNYSKEVNKDNKVYNTNSSDKNELGDKLKNISKIINLETNNKNKSKSLTNIFSKEDRYDNIHYQKQLLSKYYPGPGEYVQSEYDYDFYINQKYPFRYNSLFKLKSSFPLIDLHKTTYKVGPGSYLNSNFKNQATMGTFSKEKKNLVEPIKQSEDSPQEIDLPSSINIHEKDKKSYFFYPKQKKEENLEKKYGIKNRDEDVKIKNRNKKDFNIFGEFEGKPRWGSIEKTKDFNNDWINKNLEKKILEEKKKGNIIDIHGNMHETHLNDDNKVKQDVIYWARMARDQILKGKEETKKKKCVYTFSKIPKLIKEENHVPGPSYYDPDKLMKAIKQKNDFNFNMEMNWI